MKLFNAWINTYGLNVVVLGRHFQIARPDTKRSIAEKLKKESPIAVCLSTLYAHQGWLKEMRERVLHGWASSEYGTITRVPMPHRHGGRGRGTLARTLDETDRSFCKEALHFEFGGDGEPVPPKKPEPEKFSLEELPIILIGFDLGDGRAVLHFATHTGHLEAVATIDSFETVVRPHLKET